MGNSKEEPGVALGELRWLSLTCLARQLHFNVKQVTRSKAGMLPGISAGLLRPRHSAPLAGLGWRQ